MRKSLGQMLVAFVIGACGVMIAPTLVMAEEAGGSCSECNSDKTICNSAATGSQYCQWPMGKCLAGGGACGISGG